MTRIRPLATKNTYERLQAILRDHFGRGPELITPQASLTGNLMLDRLDVVDLFSIIGQEFGVHLTADDATHLHRIEDLVRQVDQLQAG